MSVRMYRGVLGDCFLLTLRLGGPETFILIDCGVLQNIPSGEELKRKLPPEVVRRVTPERIGKIEAGPDRIQKIVASLLETTGGRIDLVVLTHEHYDHLSGFALAQEQFEDPKVIFGRLWLAWTEDPSDPRAVELGARAERAKRALALALALGERAPELVGDPGSPLNVVADLAGFMGLAGQRRTADTPPASPTGGSSLRTTADMVNFARQKAGTERTRYLSPGDVLGPGEALGLRVYVLGPPRDDGRLRKDTPSQGAAKEVYLTGSDDAAAVEASVRAELSRRGLAAAPGRGATTVPAAPDSPFARPHRRGLQLSDRKDPRRRLKETYDDPKQAERRIEDQWLSGVEALALKLDSDTNNTSLALALELPDGQVLLFPGDAQVGNWLSWYDQSYPANPRPGEDAVIAADLLKRVVFYKVGHHGSHNATLKELGLQKMTSDRLTAAIPVVEAVAEVQGKGRKTPGAGWAMPYEQLYADLRTRTRDRIVRGDGDPVAERAAFAAASNGRQAITLRHEDASGGLWVELTFPVE
ncbi:MBL fold metallo-hydrolase [Xanthobacter versatilis]|uniref:MBL fold metallo-hydrolase n=1 Tax=Xanthobacter autotrophicus (strain ATCC BAA-1158 / Py2) TaxID=78245 RepID=UPI00372AAF7B